MKDRGFTLIELVMVIVIIGILAAIALPRFVNLTREANEAATRGGMGAIRSVVAIEYARSATSTTGASYPSTLNATSFNAGVIPTNALNTKTVISYTSAVPGELQNANSGWWYITTGASAGQVGAFSDDTSESDPTSW